LGHSSALPLWRRMTDEGTGKAVRRAVITGLGAVTPLGNTAEESWRNLCGGVSGVGPVTAFDAFGLRTRVAGQSKGFQPRTFMDPRTAKRVDRFAQLGLAAARMAVSHARYRVSSATAHRIGVVIGNCFGGVLQLEQGFEQIAGGVATRLSPFFIPGILASMAAGLIAIELGAKGPNLTVNEACASGAVAIGIGAEWIRRGVADTVIAGGCEAGLSKLIYCGYHALKATTARNNEPERASRPFDRERDGFVPAEGAGVMVLEPLGAALRRDAEPLAEVAGYATTCDAYHPTRPEPSNDSQARCMHEALADAGASPEEIGCINAHGTSTLANDVGETQAIRRVFGPRAEKVPVTANKSMIGHTIGAAGAIESIFSVLSLRDGIIPPTINYEHPDPECDLDYVPNVSRRGDLRAILSNSFGFGGINACLVLRKL
jgi:3-oxoacyl-[acyl-carrier-protein] synthase II